MADVAASPERISGTRLAALIPRSACVSFFLSVFFLFGVVESLFLGEWATPWAGLEGLGLVFAALHLRSGRRLIFLAELVLLVAALVAGTNSSMPPVALIAAARIGCILSILLLGVGAAVRRIKPLQLSMLGGAICLFLVGFEATTHGISASFVSLEEENNLFEPHERLEYAPRPRAMQRVYYPTDPRGYFERVGPQGSLDVRSWRLSFMDGGSATTPAPMGSPDQLTVVVGAGGSGKPWSVRLYRLLPYDAGHTYSVKLPVRADPPRRIILANGRASPPYESFGLYHEVDVSTEWTTIETTFTATGSDPAAYLNLVIGGKPGRVELRDGVILRDGAPLPPRLGNQFVVHHLTNRAGFRDVDRAVEKPAGVIRVACLGDSYTYGQGVKQEDVFPTRLEKLLATELSATGKRYESLNFGVSGYCAWQERGLYNEVVRAYKPDIVVLTMVINDDLSDREAASVPKGAFEYLPSFVYPILKYSLWINPSDYAGAIDQVRQLDQDCKRDHARLFVMLFRHENNRAIRALRKALEDAFVDGSVPVIDLGKEFEKRNFQDMSVHGIDPHPNEEAHQIAAEALFKAIRPALEEIAASATKLPPRTSSQKAD